MVGNAETEDQRPIQDVVAEMLQLDEEAREIDAKLAKLLLGVGAQQ